MLISPYRPDCLVVNARASCARGLEFKSWVSQIIPNVANGSPPLQRPYKYSVALLALSRGDDGPLVIHFGVLWQIKWKVGLV